MARVGGGNLAILAENLENLQSLRSIRPTWQMEPDPDVVVLSRITSGACTLHTRCLVQREQSSGQTSETYTARRLYKKNEALPGCIFMIVIR